MNCSLRAAAPDGGAFAFKTTYDESLRRFAPGLLLEVEFVRRLFERSDGIPWLDSCCGPDNTAIARLWADRRPIGDLTLAAPSLKGAAGLWALQLLAEQARRPAPIHTTASWCTDGIVQQLWDEQTVRTVASRAWEP